MGRTDSDWTGSGDAGVAMARRYRVLRRVLAANSEMLERLADLEADLFHLDPGEPRIREPVLDLLDASLLLAEDLNVLTDDKDRALYKAHAEIERAIRAVFRESRPPAEMPLVVPLDSASLAREREVGGKAARLGEVRVALPEHVPAGFVLTTAAYRLFLHENDLHDRIRGLLKDLSLVTERDLFRHRTSEVRGLIESSPVPGRIAEAIADGVMRFPMPWPPAWAVRSSAVGEDGRLSFAGQFDSLLDVPRDRLKEAYRSVLASRFSDRAVLYRLTCGCTEVDTPMAVLFLPMIEARAAGVLYTRDPREEDADRMVVNAVPGLAADMVRGRTDAETWLVPRAPDGPAGAWGAPGCLDAQDLRALADLGLKVERYFGRPQDIEWVLARDGRLHVVQARPLRVVDRRVHAGQVAESRPPLLEGGITIFPGRAVGPAAVCAGDDLSGVSEGAILVARQALPEVATVLQRLAGLIAEQGNPAGHAATLLREFGVPALFGVKDAVTKVQPGRVLSLDATHRQVFEGALWPDVLERVRVRLRHAEAGGRAGGPIAERVLALNLTDPLSRSFRPERCRSVHDMVRYTHERAMRAMFDLGDEAVRRERRRTWRLDSAVPMNLTVLDVGGAVAPQARSRAKVTPSEVRSAPFQALWRGMTDGRVSWAGRRTVSAGGFASVVAATMTDAWASIRGVGEANYLIVGPEYLNLNARLAYHFAMVDALLCEAADNNFVNFRFRGGGAGAGRRDLRARFLAEVLLRSGFGVDRRGDLVTAWLRRHPRPASEEGLALLGRLMACARQLDMLMEGEDSARRFAERFLQGDFDAFR